MNLAEMCEEPSEERGAGEQSKEEQGSGGRSKESYEMLLIAVRQMSLHLQQMCSIPQGELTMLIAISRMEKEKGYVLPSELRTAMHLSRPAVSRMLHNLEDKGYLRRRVSDSDHRFVRVEITNQGKEKMNTAIERCTDILKKVKERMGEEDMEHFLDYNKKFCRILSEEVFD